MTEEQIENGMLARDVITGFTGIVTGTVDYLTGCRQYLLTPYDRSGGQLVDNRPESQWFDIDRLEIVSSDIIQLPRGVHPGGRDEPLPEAR